MIIFWYLHVACLKSITVIHDMVNAFAYMSIPKVTSERLAGYPVGKGTDMKKCEYTVARSIEETPANDRTLLSQYFVIYPIDTPKNALLIMMHVVVALYPSKMLNNIGCLTINAAKLIRKPKRYS